MGIPRSRAGGGSGDWSVFYILRIPRGVGAEPCSDYSVSVGLQTSQDARFYALSARFEPFSNKGQTLVVQFTVKHEQNIDCGGGYVKLFPAGLDQTDMHGDSEYNIMFGEGTPP